MPSRQRVPSQPYQPDRSAHGGNRRPTAPTNSETDLSSTSKIIQQQIKKRIVGDKAVLVLTKFDPNVKRTIENSAVVLHDEVEASLNIGIQDEYRGRRMSSIV